MTLLDAIKSIPESTIDPVRRYESIRDYLNHIDQIDNPEPQGQVPFEPPTISEVFSLVQPEDLPVVETVAKLLAAGREIANATGVAYGSSPIRLLTLLRQNGLSNEAFDAISERLAQTEPDHNWIAKIPGEPVWQQLGLGGPVTLEQIQEALN